MTCYHPNKAFYVGINPDTGKNLMKFASYKVDHLISDSKGNWLPAYYSICPFKDDCQKPLCRYECKRFTDWFENSDLKHDHVVEFAVIPCSQCIGCRIQSSRDWANRMMLELQTTEGQSWFVTLTYDDDHVPVNELVDPITGEYSEVMTLCKEDLQKLNKKIRNHFGSMRFFACGEYGDKKHRPHYHIIYFGLNLDESKLIPWQMKMFNKVPYWVYRCPELEEIWQKGNVIVGHVNWHTCAYTGRYVTKKLKGKAKLEYEKLGIEPVFALMSRKPGIGKSYLRDNAEKINTTYIIRLVTDGKQMEFDPPRYFDYMIENEYPELLEQLEEHKEFRRLRAKNKMDMCLEETDKKYLDYLTTMEYLFEWKTESLMERSEL